MRQLMHIVNIQVLCEHEIFVFYRRVGWQCYTQWIGIVLIYKSNESEVAWNFLLVFSRVSFQFYLVSISTAAVQFHHVYIFVSTYLVSVQWIYWARFQLSDLVLLFHYSQMLYQMSDSHFITFCDVIHNTTHMLISTFNAAIKYKVQPNQFYLARDGQTEIVRS